MSLSATTVSRLRELREDLRKIYDLNNRIEFVMSQEIAPDDPGEPTVESLPLPTNSRWAFSDNWKVEALNRRQWWRFEITSDAANGDEKERLYWHPCTYEDRKNGAASAFWLLLPRLSLIARHSELSGLWKFFPYDRLVTDLSTNNDAIWLFLICEIAWSEPSPITSHESSQAQPAEICGLVGEKYFEGLRAHHRRIGLDRVQQEFGIKKEPTNCIWAAGEPFPPDCKALNYVHWWTEFGDLIGASIEAIDWLCRPAIEHSVKPNMHSEGTFRPVQDVDGPFGANKFRWKGEEFEMPPKAWGVVESLWNAIDRTKDRIEIAKDVWGDELSASKALTNACSEANRKFEEKEIPISLHSRKVKTARCIALDIAIPNAPETVPN